LMSKAKNREDVVKSISSRHFIVTPDGAEIPLDLTKPEDVLKVLKDIGCKPLESYVVSEELKMPPMKEPPSIKVMQGHELVGYEPSSDSGNFRFYPKGYLIFELLRDWAYDIAINRFKAIQVDSPLLFDWDDPQIKEQAERSTSGTTR